MTARVPCSCEACSASARAEVDYFTGPVVRKRGWVRQGGLWYCPACAEHEIDRVTGDPLCKTHTIELIEIQAARHAEVYGRPLRVRSK